MTDEEIFEWATEAKLGSILDAFGDELLALNKRAESMFCMHCSKRIELIGRILFK